jgi:hypothetical protein
MSFGLADVIAALNQLFGLGGLGTGGAAIYALVHIAQAVSAFRKKLQSDTASQATATTNSALDQLVHDWLMKILGPQLAAGATPTLTPDQADAGANAILIAFQQLHGGNADTSIIRDKLHSGLGKIALQVKTTLAALSNPGPPKPSAAQAAATQVMGS